MDFQDWVQTLPDILPDGSVVDKEQRSLLSPDGFYLGSLHHVAFFSLGDILLFIEKIYEDK